jgi:hypothetical protein
MIALATRQLATRQKEDALLEIVWILIGAVVGAHKFLMPGPDPRVPRDVGPRHGGAIVATFLGRLIGLYGPGQGAESSPRSSGRSAIFGYHQMRQRGLRCV